MRWRSGLSRVRKRFACHARMPASTRNRTLARSVLAAGLALAALSCAASFTEADDGSAERVLIGRDFTVSLPAVERPRLPLVEDERIVHCVGAHLDAGSGREIFDFKAVAAGETVIRIKRSSKSTDPRTFEFTVRVVLGGAGPQ